MNNYEEYSIEEFLCDEFFIEWVLAPKAEHQQFWNDWISSHPHRAEIVARAKNVLSSLNLKPVNGEISDQEISSISAYVQKHADNPVPEKKQVIRFYNSIWFRVAAVLLIAFTCGGLYLKFRNTNIKADTVNIATINQPVITTVIDSVKYTNNSNRSKFLRLSDGSLVILKPNSELIYPQKFNSANREVSLKGEGFFEVHKNPKKPFLVYSNNMVTRVVGTSFTVRAFASEHEFKVIVNTGKVLVYDNEKPGRKTNSITLIPNQQGIFNRKQSIFLKDTVVIPLLLSQETANKVFTYNNAPLADIIAKLEEAYHVQINYDKNKYVNSTVTASLSRLPLDEKIRMICKAIGAESDFNDGNISIK